DHRRPGEPGRRLRQVHRLRPQGRRAVRPHLRRARRPTPGPVRPESRGARVMARSAPAATPSLWQRPWVRWVGVLLLVVGLVVALAAARLGGLAIAMVTIALPIVGVPLAKRLSDFTGGSEGLSTRFADAPAWTGLFDDQWQLYIVLVIGGAVFLLTRSLVR